MRKSPVDMSYEELDNILDSLLKAENLPSSIEYTGNSVNYYKYDRLRLIIRVLFKIIETDLFYKTYIKRKVFRLKNAEFLDSLGGLVFTLKLVLPDLLNRLGGKFGIKMFSNYMIAAMLYDASCDISSYRKYLRDFDASIMDNKPIEPNDEYLALFKESVDYLKKNTDKEMFDTFTNYMRIVHISQLMSIYQRSAKPMTKQDLFKITLAKGGISILACTYIMAPGMSQKEKKAIYEIGGILQIFEDLYDIEEDLEMGIQTLPNQKLIAYQELKQLYIGTVNNLINQLNMNPNRPNPTLDILSHLINARFTGNIRKI